MLVVKRITGKLQKVWERVKSLFNQGLAPRELAMSIVMGSLIGVLPLFGISTAIIAFLAVTLRLNLPLAVFMTYAVSPIHLLLIIPFIRIGEYVMGVQHSLITLVAIQEAFSSNFLQAIRDLIFQIGCGLVGWIIAGIPFAYFMYLGLRLIFEHYHEPKLNKEV